MKFKESGNTKLEPVARFYEPNQPKLNEISPSTHVFGESSTMQPSRNVA